MSETTDKAIRLSKVAREFNQGLHTVVEFLTAKGFSVEQNTNDKIDAAEVDLLIGDATKAREVLGWVPKTTFRALVTKMVRADCAEYGDPLN